MAGAKGVCPVLPGRPPSVARRRSSSPSRKPVRSDPWPKPFSNHFHITIVRDPGAYFRRPQTPAQRRYEALRAYFLDRCSTAEVAHRFGYTPGSVRVLCTLFRQDRIPEFFAGRPAAIHQTAGSTPLRDRIRSLRELRLSVYDIASRLTAEGHPISHQTVWLVLKDLGVERLPKRTAAQKDARPAFHPPVADIAERNLAPGRIVDCRAPLLFLFAPLLAQVDFDGLVRQARYPGSHMIPGTAALRSLLALKLLSRPRKNHVMPVADDQGFGLFAGLNVLPKTTFLSDYSFRVGPKPHRALLRGVVGARAGMDAFPSLSFNVDFHTIRHYGEPENSHLEKDYVTRRSQSVRAVVSAFAQEAQSREMVYANANILKREKADEVVRFVDYWRKTTGKLPEELVIDCHMTTHSVLEKLDRMGITFITLRDRKPNEVKRVLAAPPERWKRVELEAESRKWRTPRVLDERIDLSDYYEVKSGKKKVFEKQVRQIAALDLGREEPTLVLTNDTRRGPATLLTRYAKRTNIENSLGEQVGFFHVNALSSSVRIKVDLDVVLSVIASGCYRWLATRLKGFETATARTIWETFLDRPGRIRLTESEVVLQVRRFSRAPQLVEAIGGSRRTPLQWVGGRTVRVEIT